jgi:hypothetical protein
VWQATRNQGLLVEAQFAHDLARIYLGGTLGDGVGNDVHGSSLVQSVHHCAVHAIEAAMCSAENCQLLQVLVSKRKLRLS